MTRPTMSGRPALSCAACQSMVMVPALPTWVELPDRGEAGGAWAELGAASSQSEQASDALIVARALMPTPPRSLEVPGGGKVPRRGLRDARKDLRLERGGA